MITESKQKLIEADKEGFQDAIKSYEIDLLVEITKYIDANMTKAAVSLSVPVDQVDWDFNVVPGIQQTLIAAVRSVLFYDHGILFETTNVKGNEFYELTKAYWKLAHHIDEVVAVNKSSNPDGMEFDRKQFFNEALYERRKEKLEEIWQDVLSVLENLDDVEIIDSDHIKVKYNEDKHRVPEEEE